MPDMITPKVGRYIKPDQWKTGECLIPSDWDKAQFRIPAGHGMYELAVNIAVTGHSMKRVNGGWAVRVKVTFVGDDEPDQTTGAWMFPGEELGMDLTEISQDALNMMVSNKTWSDRPFSKGLTSLSYKDFRGLDFRGMDLCGAEIHSSDFRGAKMDETTLLTGCNLTYSDFRYTNFNKTQHDGANLVGTFVK